MDVGPTNRTGLPARTGAASTSASAAERPVGEEQLMERVLERPNLVRALKRGERNKGAAGIAG